MNTIKQFVLILAVLFYAAGTALAADDFWNVDANGIWTNASNWLMGNVPGNSATFDLPITADRVVTLGANQSVSTISFGNPSSYKFTIQANQLTFGSGVCIQTLPGNGDHVDTVNSLFYTDAAAANSGNPTITAGATSPNSLLRIGNVFLHFGVSPGGLLVLNGSNTGLNTVAGVIYQSVPSRIVKSDAGTWVLSGANTFSGGVTVNGGLLTLDAGAGGSIPANSTLAFGGNGKFNYDNSTAAVSKSLGLGALTNSAGDGTVQITRTAAQTVTLTFSSMYSRPAGVARNFFYAGTPGTIGTESRIVITAAPTVGVLIDQGTFCNGDYAAYDSGNFMRAMNYTTDNSSGGANVGSAFATFTAAGANGKFVDLGTAGSITAAGTESINTLRIGANSTANTVIIGGGNTLTISNGGILKAGGSASTISGGTAIAPSVELVIRTDVGSDSLTISTPITGANSLVKCGAGTLALSGANTYSGQTYLNNGTTVIGANSALGDVATGAQLNLNNATLQTTATMTLDNGGANMRNVVLANNNVFDMGTNNLTISGVVSGTGGFTKTGAGTMTLSAAATCSGPTTVNQGTLVIYSLGGTINIASNATLNVGNSSGYISLVNAGTVYFVAGGNGVIMNPGDTVLNNGTLTGPGGSGWGCLKTRGWGGDHNRIIANGASNLINTTNAISLINDLTLYTPKATDVLTIRCLLGAPSAANASPVIKTGLGTVILSGANVYYTGFTTNFSGVIAVGADNALGAGQVTFLGGNLAACGSCSLTNQINLASNVTINTAGYNLTLSGAITNTGSLTKIGAGTLTLSGANTYTGATTIAAGTLSLGATNALSTNAVIYIVTGATNNLNYSNAMMVDAVYINGKLQSHPIITRDNSGPYFTGAGKLNVNRVSAPGGLVIVIR